MNNFSFLFPKRIYGGVLCGSFSPAPSDGVFVDVCAEGIRKVGQITASPRTRHPELVSGSIGGTRVKEKDSEINSE